MQPVAPAADVGEDEGDVGVTARQRAELDRVGRFLPRPVVATMLPNVLEDGNAPLQRQDGDRIEQRIVRAAARRQLDTDHARIETPYDLRPGVCGVVRVDAHVATDRFRMRALQREEGVIAGGYVPGRREVGRRREAVTAQDRGHMYRDPDLLAGGQAPPAALAPVGTRRPLMVKVRVDVDEHCYNLRRIYLVGRP